MADVINRRPVGAGRFYPSNPKQLKKDVEMHLKHFNVKRKKRKRPLGFIVPHAGYVFSGDTAASCFARLKKQEFSRIVLLGASHFASFKGVALMGEEDFNMPLGVVKVDREVCENLIASDVLFKNLPDAHAPEHSLEVQLPFLQIALGTEFKVIPLLIGQVSPENCAHIAKLLVPLVDENTLFVVSSDLSHYPSSDDARRVDAETIESMISGNPDHYMEVRAAVKAEHIPNLETSCCGWTAVLTFLYLIREFGEVEMHKIHYSNSGDSVYGDTERVVGYVGIEALLKESVGDRLKREERAQLLHVAYEAIFEKLKRGRSPLPSDSGFSGMLLEPLGAFVSVYVKDKLRGCIGRFEVDTPLFQTVHELAISASIRDTRFKSLHFDELNDLHIEISVLSPLERIYRLDEIEVGKHGIYLRKGLHSGTFLPQVAVAKNWSAEEFVRNCAKFKAGIGYEGWCDAEMYVFEVEVMKK